jgi:hypothetical protein
LGAAGVARAQTLAEGRPGLGDSGLPDAVSAWAEPGRPGWFPDAWNPSGAPWTLAGLGVGGLWLDEPGGGPAVLPAPGIASARRALSWSDTLVVSLLDDAAWRGFGSGLARLRGTAVAPGPGRAVAMFQSINGTNSYWGNALGIERGDSLSGLGVEMQTTNVGASGSFERSGRHVWGLSARGARGAYQWRAAYAQRGSGLQLADGDEEHAAGESGSLDYRYHAPRAWGRMVLERGYTHQESYGIGLPYSRRDAQENRAALEAGSGLGAGQLALRLDWRGASAARVTDLTGVFDHSIQQFWSAGRFDRPLGTGRLEASFGAGRDGGSERWSIAPTVSTAFDQGARRMRLSLGRLLQPIWSDLAPGEKPFLQSTWAAGAEFGAGGARGRAQASVLAGRTADRALVSRLPLADLWMREGLRRDVMRYRFALASMSGGTRFGPLDVSGEGYLLGRDRDGGEPQVDPNWGARASTSYRFSAFQGDLGVALRGEAEWVGERETEEAVPRHLAAVTSFGAAAVITLADAALTLRARNLEDRPRALGWVDPISGRLALGPGVEVRGTFTWRLFN